MREFLKSRFSPFRHRDFRLFFFVQAASLVGQWSHDLARSWIILEIMQKAGALGSLQLAIAVPSLLFILQGGVIVDRVDVRYLMMFTKGVLAVSALFLAYVSEFSQIEFWMLLVFGVIEGCVVAFDSPAYQALTVRLVPRADFQQALALNSTNFHAARMLGPLVAGVLMASYGPSLVFLFDGLSYILLIFVLKRLSLRSVQTLPLQTQSFKQSLSQGFLYVRNSPAILYMVIQLTLTISLMVPLMMVVFRTLVQKKFDLDAEQFGFVFTLPALGSMIGALSFTALKPKRPIRALSLGVPGTIAGALLVPWAPTAALASLAMTFTGFFMYLSLASLTVSLHLQVEEEFRGRLGAIIGLGFMSLAPLLCFPMGLWADLMGATQTIWITAFFFLFASATLRYLHREARAQLLRTDD